MGWRMNAFIVKEKSGPVHPGEREFLPAGREKGTLPLKEKGAEVDHRIRPAGVGQARRLGQLPH